MPSTKDLGVSAVPARYLRELVHHLNSLGFGVEAVLKAESLDLAMLEHPHARIDRQQLSATLLRLAKATGRSDLGFELGSRINIATADVIGQLLLSSPTLSSGMVCTSRYFALLTPSYRLQVGKSLEGYRLRCEPTQSLPYQVAVMGLEILAVSMHRLIMFLMQERSVPVQLDASWPTPPHAARYRELKGLRVRFGTCERPEFLMTLPSALAEAPLPMANPAAVKAIEEICKQMLDEITRKHSWVQWVGMMLYGVDGHFPSQSELAAMMQISGRTLARSLATEGVEYRELAQRIRHGRALDLLTGTALPLADIAYRLGYSDAANFSRAFRKRQGQSPGEHRHAASARSDARHASAVPSVQLPT